MNYNPNDSFYSTTLIDKSLNTYKDPNMYSATKKSYSATKKSYSATKKTYSANKYNDRSQYT
jgi:hypothetical protein